MQVHPLTVEYDVCICNDDSGSFVRRVRVAMLECRCKRKALPNHVLGPESWCNALCEGGQRFLPDTK